MGNQEFGNKTDYKIQTIKITNKKIHLNIQDLVTLFKKGHFREQEKKQQHLGFKGKIDVFKWQIADFCTNQQIAVFFY